MELLPCRICLGKIKRVSYRDPEPGSERLYFVYHTCLGPEHATAEAAAAEWNAANAAPDPTLGALARFGADVIASHRGVTGKWAQPSLLALPDIARDIGVTVSGQFAPGIASAIARLLAPDGADGAGEVTGD